MKVLIVGGGAREHALAWKISQSPRLESLFCAPGNAGMDAIAETVDLDILSPVSLSVWAAQQEIDLTIVGPEAPLAQGLVNEFTERGLRVFGPTKEGCQLESSKHFAKDVMRKAGIPTAASESFTNFEEAKAYVEERGAPIVIKADGLAAGKGVTVAMTVEEAVEALRELLVAQALGEAGSCVLVEDFLVGHEASLMAIVEGETVLPLVASQDYKRIGDGDSGPNTGGMGAISPTPHLPDERVDEIAEQVLVPVVQELWNRGIRYSGFLYAGLMIDEQENVQVLEFNCRLGDPETQVLMLRLRSDLLEVIDAAKRGALSSVELKWERDAAVCVVAASAGYPGRLDDGKAVLSVPRAGGGVEVFHAGTRPEGTSPTGFVTKGGRVFSICARGATIATARADAYRAMEQLAFEGMQFRSDIGAAAESA